MKATKQYFPVVPFIMRYKVSLTSESGGNPEGDHSNEAIILSTAFLLLFIMLYEVVPTFGSVDEILEV